MAFKAIGVRSGGGDPIARSRSGSYQVGGYVACSHCRDFWYGHFKQGMNQCRWSSGQRSGLCRGNQEFSTRNHFARTRFTIVSECFSCQGGSYACVVRLSRAAPGGPEGRLNEMYVVPKRIRAGLRRGGSGEPSHIPVTSRWEHGILGKRLGGKYRLGSEHSMAVNFGAADFDFMVESARFCATQPVCFRD